MRYREIKIASSILSADFADFGAECQAIEAAGCDWVHVDVMDGHFVPNITFGPTVCAAIRPHVSTVMDVHLMISPVDPLIEAFADAGADIITAHVESSPHVHRTLQAIQATGAKVGVALNPATSTESVASLLDMVDLICVMTVNPGFGGQKFICSQLAKIAALADLVGDRPIQVEVDGGINVHTAALVAERGADVLVAGSAIFEGGTSADPSVYRRNIKELRDSAAKAQVRELTE